MIKSFEYDATDAGLYNLLVWWGTIFPYNSRAYDHEEYITANRYSLEGKPWIGHGLIPVSFRDVTTGEETDITNGAMIFYDEGSKKMWVEVNG